ncbi:hypothetical protein ACA910_020190 [Epithemia clementina (nom. ined.)]
MTTDFEFFNEEDEDEDDADGVGEFGQLPKTSIADDVEILPVDEVGGDVEDLGKVEATDGDDEGDNGRCVGDEVRVVREIHNNNQDNPNNNNSVVLKRTTGTGTAASLVATSSTVDSVAKGGNLAGSVGTSEVGRTKTKSTLSTGGSMNKTTRQSTIKVGKPAAITQQSLKRKSAKRKTPKLSQQSSPRLAKKNKRQHNNSEFVDRDTSTDAKE